MHSECSHASGDVSYLANKKRPLRRQVAVERIGIEPMTSSVQTQGDRSRPFAQVQ